MNVKATLTKKVGPLPMWAWMLAVGLGIGYAVYARRHPSAKTDTGTDETPLAPGVPQETPGDLGFPAGGGGGGMIPTDPVSFSGGGIPSEIHMSIDPLVIENAVATSAMGNDEGPVSEPSGPRPFEPGNAPTETFSWGGRTWSKADKAGFQRWLRDHGSTYQGWVNNHAPAAKRVFGDVPQNIPKPAAPKPATPIAKAGVTGGGTPKKAVAVVKPPTPKYYTYKKDVPLNGGKTLKFTAGKGYYAG